MSEPLDLDAIRRGYAEAGPTVWKATAVRDVELLIGEITALRAGLAALAAALVAEGGGDHDES